MATRVAHTLSVGAAVVEPPANLPGRLQALVVRRTVLLGRVARSHVLTCVRERKKGPVHTGRGAPRRRRQIMEHSTWSVGVFTQLASNIKGFAHKHANLLTHPVGTGPKAAR